LAAGAEEVEAILVPKIKRGKINISSLAQLDLQ